MKKVAIIGHFGFGLNCLDGQTIKTKILRDELESEFGKSQIQCFDTHGGVKTLLKSPLIAFLAMWHCKNVIVLPAHRGVKIFVPLLAIFGLLFRRRRIHYVVVGGWLPEMLDNNAWLTRFVKSCYAVYVETQSMARLLGRILDNVVVMPNCKPLKICAENEIKTDFKEPYRLCTFSRVSKEKGIGLAVDAVLSVNKLLKKKTFVLDIYGQIDRSEQERSWFEDVLKKDDESIAYRGEVDFDKSVDVLRNYFALLFPSYYSGEGFPGTFLDAFASGLPIIASDWKYNSELITEGKTGMIFKARDVNMLEKDLLSVAENPQKLINMRMNCRNQAFSFLPHNVLQTLCKNLL